MSVHDFTQKRYTLGKDMGYGLYSILDYGQNTLAVTTEVAILNIDDACEITGGLFYDGIFNGGEYYDGEFYGGTFYGGTYTNGDYFGGSYHSGVFKIDDDFYGGQHVPNLGLSPSLIHVNMWTEYYED